MINPESHLCGAPGPAEQRQPFVWFSSLIFNQYINQFTSGYETKTHFIVTLWS